MLKKFTYLLSLFLIVGSLISMGYSVPWDISDTQFEKSNNILGVGSNAYPVFMTNNNTQVLYDDQGSGDLLYLFDLDTSKDIGSTTYNQDFDYTGEASYTTGWYISEDLPTHLIMVSGENDNLYHYELNSPFEISSASLVETFDLSTHIDNAYGVFMKPDGTKLFVGDDTGNSIESWNLGTAMNFSTASHANSLDTTQFGSGTVFSLNIKQTDGSKLYYIDYTDTKYVQLGLGTSWDISTATFETEYSITRDNNPFSATMSNDGTKWYMAGTENDQIYQYNIAPPTLNITNVTVNGIPESNISALTLTDTMNVSFDVEVIDTSSNVNLSYSIDGGSYNIFDTGSTSGTFTETLTNGNYDILLKAENDETSDTYNFSLYVNKNLIFSNQESIKNDSNITYGSNIGMKIFDTEHINYNGDDMVMIVGTADGTSYGIGSPYNRVGFTWLYNESGFVWKDYLNPKPSSFYTDPNSENETQMGAITQDNEGYLYSSGTVGDYGGGFNDRFFTTKYDKNGNRVWLYNTTTTYQDQNFIYDNDVNSDFVIMAGDNGHNYAEALYRNNGTLAFSFDDSGIGDYVEGFRGARFDTDSYDLYLLGLYYDGTSNRPYLTHYDYTGNGTWTPEDFSIKKYTSLNGGSNLRVKSDYLYFRTGSNEIVKIDKNDGDIVSTSNFDFSTDLEKTEDNRFFLAKDTNMSKLNNNLNDLYDISGINFAKTKDIDPFESRYIFETGENYGLFYANSEGNDGNNFTVSLYQTQYILVDILNPIDGQNYTLDSPSNSLTHEFNLDTSYGSVNCYYLIDGGEVAKNLGISSGTYSKELQYLSEGTREFKLRCEYTTNGDSSSDVITYNIEYVEEDTSTTYQDVTGLNEDEDIFVPGNPVKTADNVKIVIAHNFNKLVPVALILGTFVIAMIVIGIILVIVRRVGGKD